MDYESMSLTELKKLAKNHTPKIKQYYIKSKAELIVILNMKEFTSDMIIEKMTIDTLRAEVKKLGHTNIWKLRREQLVALLTARPHKDDENDDHTQEHDNPEEGKRE
jgi:hypothetical protein